MDILNTENPTEYGVSALGRRHLRDQEDEWEGGRANAGKTSVIKEGTLRRARRAFSESGPARLGEPDADGYHPWGGGIIPVEPYTKVRVIFRGGFLTKSGEPVQASAFRFDWEHTGGNDDIIGLRLVS